MHWKLIISVLFLSNFSLSQSFDTDDGPLPILGSLIGRSEEIVERVLQNVLTSEESRRELQAFIANEVDEEEEYVTFTCLECRNLIGLLLGMINQGQTFEQARDEMVDICTELAEEEGVHGDILCPGVIDIQGPHVFYILNETDHNALELCTLYNVCEGDGNSTRGVYTYKKLKREKKAEPKPKRDLQEGTIKILALADIHIDKDYVTGAAVDCGLPNCCKEYYFGEGEARGWGEGICNVPMRTLELILASLALLKPDFIVYAGDSPPHTAWNETQKSQFDASRFVTEAIAIALPGVPAYPAIGNHENYPTNLYYPPLPGTQLFNSEFTKYWQDLADFGDEQRDTIAKSGYYSMLQRPGLRLISYNTNYGYKNNFYNVLSLDDSEWLLEMQDWLITELQNATDNGETVLLLGHHPMGADTTFISFGRWMTEVLLKFGDIITLHTLGHHHNDFYRLVINNETGLAHSVQMCMNTAGSRTNKNPTARIIYIDEDTFEPLDYDTYYIDLAETMKDNDPPEMKFGYRASEEYGMDDITAQSWQDLTDRFEDDQELFERYRYNFFTRTTVPSPCTGACKEEELCRLRTSSYDTYRDCLAQVPPEEV